MKTLKNPWTCFLFVSAMVFLSASIELICGVFAAQPPIGAWQWKPPQPVKPWPGIQPASEFKFSSP